MNVFSTAVQSQFVQDPVLRITSSYFYMASCDRTRSWKREVPFLCVGCDIVQADHAPEAGVAQGIFHGILVRQHGGIQEEVEEGLEDEVERQGAENTQEQVRMPRTMDGNEDTQTRLEPHVTVCA